MSEIDRKRAIEELKREYCGDSVIMRKAKDFAVASLETDEAYQLEYETTTKNDCETCIHNKGVLECDMYGCKYEPITKNDLGVDCISRAYLLDDSKYHTVFNDDTGNFEDVVYREDIEKAPLVTPTRPKGHWLRMSDLSEQEDDRYKCSCCGNVIHHKNKMNLYTFNSWCGRCGSDNGR